MQECNCFSYSNKRRSKKNVIDDKSDQVDNNKDEAVDRKRSFHER